MPTPAFLRLYRATLRIGGMWDLQQVPVCIVTENMLYCHITSHPELAERVHLGHSEFWQDSVALRRQPQEPARF